jgi:hypothetical protein
MRNRGYILNSRRSLKTPSTDGQRSEVPAVFELPFTVEISPDLESVRGLHDSWMLDHGLIAQEAGGRHSIGRYQRFDLPRLAALVWPYAMGADLKLACDVVGWTLIFDDWFDARPQPATVAALVQELLEAVHNPSGTLSPQAHVLTRAFSDLWARCIDGMPIWWRRRAAHNWEYYICANAHEAASNGATRPPALDHFLMVRRGTVCLENYVDLTERFGRFTLAASTFHIPQLRVARNIATLVPALTNDVVSLPKEEAQGEVNNIVLVLECINQCSREEAISLVRQLIDEHVTRFRQLTDELPTLCSEFNLTEEQFHSAVRYVDAQRLWMAGFEEWSQHTARYRNQPGVRSEGGTK